MGIQHGRALAATVIPAEVVFLLPGKTFAQTADTIVNWAALAYDVIALPDGAVIKNRAPRIPNSKLPGPMTPEGPSSSAFLSVQNPR